jgi:hypothetical protein
MPKNTITLPFLILITLILLTISVNDVFLQTSFKGVELNSWKPASGDWHFTVLIATNRKKSIQEITDPKVTIVGVDNLKKKLSELPKGENVYWVNYAKEPIPRKIRKDLTKYCKAIGINLHADTI